MSMYVDLLTNALEGWTDDPQGEVLLDYVLECRNEMLASVPRRAKSAYVALATEIAYDRALIKLCVSRGIAVTPADFSHPREERELLEQALSDQGLDLATLAKRHL